MGLCYSLRPLLFGVPSADSELPAEDARPGLATAQISVPEARGDAATTPEPVGACWSPARARAESGAKKEKRRRPELLRAEEREAEREARKVSRGIDRMLREQKRDLQQTHRLLLLGRYGRTTRGPARRGVRSGGRCDRGSQLASASLRGLAENTRPR